MLCLLELNGYRMVQPYFHYVNITNCENYHISHLGILTSEALLKDALADSP